MEKKYIDLGNVFKGLLIEQQFDENGNQIVREEESSDLTKQEKEIIIWAIKEHAKYPAWILNDLKGTCFENIKYAGELLLIYGSIVKKLEKNGTSN